MDFEIDESKIFYGLGAFLGVISIIYFGHELILDLSPTIKAFILLSGTVIFLSSASMVNYGLLKSVFYIFSAFSYLSFLVYLFARFSLSSGEIFTVLAVSSAVFTGLGYLRSEKGYELGREKARKVLFGVGAILALLVVFDVTGAQPEYTLSLEDEVQVVEGEELQVGVLEVENRFLLSRNIEVPRFEGCLSTSPDEEPRRVYMSPESSGLIAGRTTETFELKDQVNERYEENRSISGNYSIANEECPDELDENTIYVKESGGDPILRSVED